MPDPGDSRGLITAGTDRLTLDVMRDSGDWGAFEPVETHVDAALRALLAHKRFLDLPPSEACIALSNDAVVRGLNANYRAKDKPTNVLSFPAGAMRGAPAAVRSLGDVVLAEETVLREAKEQDIAPEHHLQHLVVHGLLHLLGFDHETDAEAQEMERLEIEILASIGIANPYADVADDSVRAGQDH